MTRKVEQSFSAGCVFFSVKNSNLFKLSKNKQIEESINFIIEDLRKIPNITNISCEDIDSIRSHPDSVDWLEIPDRILVSDIPFPRFSSGVLRFEIFLSSELQEKFSLNWKEVKSTDFIVTIYFNFEHPVCILRPKIPHIEPDISGAVTTLWHFLRDSFNSNEFNCDFHIVGPTPFHCDFFISKIEDDSKIEENSLPSMKMVTQPGYNDCFFEFSDTDFDLDQIQSFVFRYVVRSLGPFYFTVHSTNQIYDIRDSITEILEVIEENTKGDIKKIKSLKSYHEGFKSIPFYFVDIENIFVEVEAKLLDQNKLLSSHVFGNTLLEYANLEIKSADMGFVERYKKLYQFISDELRHSESTSAIITAALLGVIVGGTITMLTTILSIYYTKT
ncbi:hypothetical protein T8K17_05920 [Thalassobaculum sp. OXR-137]|uniref:hypothetical protein n=1 Tax=Thalassobaculum sp. OXR-137 TaxID=3100173 RepID=UPI002AC96A30|nr:hypothetical protein [Thalassobaculum sp. OXR-137]WPZ35678.1 hypothetical protein T8K17_05920 [Thalassobaculum sp. OXR-137]